MRIAGLLLIFVATFAHAQLLGRNEIYVMGAGSESCGKWLETRNYEAARLARAQWLLGYVTASNYANKSRQVRPQDGYSALAFVDQYCSNNPLDTVVFAAAALIESLGGQKADHTWKR